jgi:hypothetical protein
MASEVIQGDLDVVRHPDGRVEIRQAPQTTYLTLEFLTAADPAVVRVQGRQIFLAGQVEYRVTGWDVVQGVLLAERCG